MSSQFVTESQSNCGVTLLQQNTELTSKVLAGERVDVVVVCGASHVSWGTTGVELTLHWWVYRLYRLLYR